MSGGKRILFVVTEDWYFWSHRLPLALHALKAGMEVAVATNVADHRNKIEALGIKVFPWPVQRGSFSLFREVVALTRLLRIYRSFRPDLVHQVAIKPVIYGGIAGLFVRGLATVNALGGMGTLFAQNRQQGFLSLVVMMGFQFLATGQKKLLILQNPDDVALLSERARISLDRIRIVRGAGVNITHFSPTRIPDFDRPSVILPARMLADKGIREFVSAAAELRARNVRVRLVLVGGLDPCNPSRIDQDELLSWVKNGLIEWLGRCEDMPEILNAATIVCLPSYREGLPKALLEAAACARPIIATDVPGCREIVLNEFNGILVPPQKSAAIADAIVRLLSNPSAALEMGRRGRSMVEECFSENAIVKQTFAIYAEIMRPNEA